MTQSPNLFTFAGSFSFLSGFTLAGLMGLLIKIGIGIKTKLYLVSHEPYSQGRIVIPLTAELKKRTLWKTLLQKDWKEDIELTLGDYKGNSFAFHIHYELLYGFKFTLKAPSELVQLNSKKVSTGRAYTLKSGHSLILGDRSFVTLVTTANLETLENEGTRVQLPI